MSDNHQVKLTQQGYDALEAELSELTENKIPTAIQRVSVARSQGDLRENSEYHAAREELAMLEAKRDELQSLVQNAKIIKKSKSQKVQLGSEVEITIDGQAKKQTFFLVSEWEADPVQKKISEKSPIGQALLGKKAGEKAVIQAPAGDVVYNVIKVS